jgi:hypothetical protein
LLALIKGSLMCPNQRNMRKAHAWQWVEEIQVLGVLGTSCMPRGPQRYLYSCARARAILPAQINSDLCLSLPNSMKQKSSAHLYLRASPYPTCSTPKYSTIWKATAEILIASHIKLSLWPN